MVLYKNIFVKQNNLDYAILVSNHVEKIHGNELDFYIIDKPLIFKEYHYEYEDSFILIIPSKKILFINLNELEDELFNTYVDDIKEDIATLSQKHSYIEKIGRPRSYRDIFETIPFIQFIEKNNTEFILITDPRKARVSELISSLLIGSVNDINKITIDKPDTILGLIRNKITLYDNQQTNFIYNSLDKKIIRIQGLSGTGKTELLLHKLIETYNTNDHVKVFFTCWNKVLSNHLKSRIPQFFNFMNVGKQIEWNHSFWCSRAWGTNSNPNEGLLSFLCKHYDIPFFTYREQNDFSKFCSFVLKELNKQDDFNPILDYIFIDESQDFSEEFFEICDKVTSTKVYAAGDIFQNLFIEPEKLNLETDFVLNKVYRTDPRTFTFAQGLAMGFFENQPLGWIEDEELKRIGYKIERKDSQMTLFREPVRRFEDIKNESPSIIIKECRSAVVEQTIAAIKETLYNHEDATINDFCIIFLDTNSRIYSQIDDLEVALYNTFKWKITRGFDIKYDQEDRLFVSNRYNVKGLEYPFVICISHVLTSSTKYRNSLYTMLTRSFITSYLLFYQISFFEIEAENIKKNLSQVNNEGSITFQEPNSATKELVLRNLSQLNIETTLNQKIADALDKYKPGHSEEVLIKAMQSAEHWEIENNETLVVKFIKSLPI
jgi:superfamily I DNA and RNA helicase